MKKYLLILVIVINTSVFSQVTIKPGVRAGISFSNFTNSDLDTKTDIYIGGFAAIKLARFYTIQPELNLTRIGAESNFPNSDIEIQYIGVSIANKFSPFKEIGVHAIVGPAINVRLTDNYFDGFYDDIENFDIVIFGGFGYDFPFGLGIEARYNIGLVDIFGYNVNNEYGDNDIDNLILNKFFQIGATYKFDL